MINNYLLCLCIEDHLLASNAFQRVNIFRNLLHAYPLIKIKMQIGNRRGDLSNMESI